MAAKEAEGETYFKSAEKVPLKGQVWQPILRDKLQCSTNFFFTQSYDCILERVVKQLNKLESVVVS